MRAVGLSDLDVAARALMSVPPAQRAGLAASLIEGAHAADLWRKRHGVAHPGGGTGSLYAQACLHPRAPARWCCGSYCAALGVVLEALQTWRDRGHHTA